MGKRPDLVEIVKSCELKFNRGDSAQWKNIDFSDLSREVQKSTKVNISTSTLKRIFGKVAVDHFYVPQQATIEALQKYADIKDQPETLRGDPLLAQKPSKKDRLIVTISIIIAFGIITSLCWFYLIRTDVPARIILKETEGSLPATAFFELQVPAQKDSLFLSFGDKSKLLLLKPNDKKKMHTYLLPGVFNADIRTGHKKLASTTVYVRSDKWIGLGFRDDNVLSSNYYEFPATKTGSDSLFHISNKQLAHVGLDTTNVFNTRLCNFSPFNQSADDFVLDATFRNSTPENGVYCGGTQFQVTGLDNLIRFKVVNSGCSLYARAALSEQRLNGSKINLSTLVTDLRKWNTVKLVNRHKQVTLYLNGKQVYTGTYKKTLGEVRGVFLEFDGNGYVKNLDLRTLEGKRLYRF